MTVPSQGESEVGNLANQTDKNQEVQETVNMRETEQGMQWIAGNWDPMLSEKISKVVALILSGSQDAEMESHTGLQRHCPNCMVNDFPK